MTPKTALVKRIHAYRKETFRTDPGLRIRSLEEALAYVNQRDFIFFWPIKGIIFPSLWMAVAGEREVANDHDDPGHITWGWKDEMLGKKKWYYGRILRRKNTILSLDAMLRFYALSPNYGEYEEDYLIQYAQGLMTAESKAIYEALLFEGPLDTISLRKAARMASKSSASRFQRAIDQLQFEMKILPTGVSKAGAWRYAFIYDIVPRHFTTIEADARPISEVEARIYLLHRYVESMGASGFAEIKKFFNWKEKELNQAINHLLQGNQVKRCPELPDYEKGIILNSLL